MIPWKFISVVVVAAGMIAGTVLGQPETDTLKVGPNSKDKKAQVTFVELGSVKCIPCRQMQPVMKAIEKKYGDQVRVVFHDVWTDQGSSQAETYKIKLIPTQVFLDENGREFFRHEGFYPEEQIHTLLKKRGLKILAAGK
jgi:thioredoxin 1